MTGVFASRASTKTTEAAKNLANEDRRQQRIRDAYVTIELYIASWERIAEWATRTYSTGDSEPQLPAVSAEGEAVAALVASEPVVQAVRVYNVKLQSFRVALGHWEDLKQVLEHPSDTTVNDALAGLKKSAAALIESGEQVHGQMRKELAGELG